jgi:hypothetical protein
MFMTFNSFIINFEIVIIKVVIIKYLINFIIEIKFMIMDWLLKEYNLFIN